MLRTRVGVVCACVGGTRARAAGRIGGRHPSTATHISPPTHPHTHSRHAHLARVRLVLFDARVARDAHVVVHAKVEERAALAARLVEDELVKGVVVRQDEVLLVRGVFGGGGVCDGGRGVESC